MNFRKESAVAAAIVVVALSARPVAADVHCPPHRGETTVQGNVLVVAACELDETRVKGNVVLYTGGSLAADEATIDGNIEAHTAFEIELVDSRVRGNIELVELVGDSSSIIDSRVDGNLELRRNRSFVLLEDNEVDSIEALQNTGGLHIVDNDVKGDLTCSDNDPAPTGGNNEVKGGEQGQCRDLVQRKDEDEDDDEDDDERDDDDTPGGSSGPVAPGSASGSGSNSGSGSSGAPGSDSNPGSGSGNSDSDSGSDIAPINLIMEPSGGGGSTDLLTLLAASLLLVWPRRGRTRGRRFAIQALSQE